MPFTRNHNGCVTAYMLSAAPTWKKGLGAIYKLESWSVGPCNFAICQPSYYIQVEHCMDENDYLV